MDITGEASELLYFRVTITEGETGSPTSPLPFSREGLTYTLMVEAMGGDGNVYKDYGGPARIEITTGLLDMDYPYMEFDSGVVDSVDFAISLCHGETYFWVEDDGQGMGTYAAGLSPTLHFDDPTVKDIQESDRVDTSILEGETLQVKTSGRTLVVTGVFSDGFFVTDLNDSEWNSLYIYNFHFPEGVREGKTLTSLSGTVNEFYGLTELSYPYYETGKGGEIPDPSTLSSCEVTDDLLMESLESSLVRVEDATVEEMTYHFYQYGEWSVRLSDECGEGSVYVYSAGSVPSFDPEEMVGETIPSIEGNLKNFALNEPYLWIIHPRDDEDIAL